MDSPTVKRFLPWVVAMALFMEQLDSTIVNTAVPSMAASLHVTPLSLKAVVASYILSPLGITLKQHNSQLRGCCPIHKGTDQRGFVVTPAKGLYYCFGGCGGGDMIKLVSKMRQCDAKEAAQWIAGKKGFHEFHEVLFT